jgi:hypothetical protein
VFGTIFVIAKRWSCYNHPFMFSTRDFLRVLLLIAILGPSGAISSCAQSASAAQANASSRRLSDPDNATLISALRQALEISSTKAIAQTGKRDGFLENEAIRILLPPKLQAIGKSMRMLGRGDEVDELEIGMNRVAEDATPQAKPIFMAALKNLVWKDPDLILTGGNTAATEYFRRSSSADLSAAFTPIVHRFLERHGVTKQYKHVLDNDPGGNAIASEFDLDKYVVDQTLQGIFAVMASQESNIRNDPSAQTSDVLKQVFGGK